MFLTTVSNFLNPCVQNINNIIITEFSFMAEARQLVVF